MADMHKFPRNSVELAQHESVVPEEQIKANKSLKKFAVVLAACAILFLGVMAVAGKWGGPDGFWNESGCNPNDSGCRTSGPTRAPRGACVSQALR